MHIQRTRFKKDIVTEFLPPVHFKEEVSQKVLIICGGMPSMPSKGKLMRFFSRKGYFVFFPRYRGSWESSGEFLKESPEQDVLDLIGEIPQGFADIQSGEKYHFVVESIYVLGTSFGGAAALLASRDPRVSKVICVSPVVDWSKLGEAEPIDETYTYVKSVFGEGYRIKRAAWDKLKSGTFYNPVQQVKEIEGRKIFIVHAKNDDSVLYEPVAVFARKVGATLKTYSRGGHLSSSIVTKPFLWWQVRRFLGK